MPVEHRAEFVTEPQVIATIKEFEQVVEVIYGIYLDSVLGFRLIMERQNKMRQLHAEKFHFTSEQSDNSLFNYGVGDPNTPESYVLHECSMQKLRERNEKDGLNYKTIGNLCLVLVYQFWEDNCRHKLENISELRKNAIQSPLWGDIGRLRNSIIHNNGIAIDNVNKCSILTWFKAGEEIFINDKQFEMLILQVKKELNELPQKIRDKKSVKIEK